MKPWFTISPAKAELERRTERSEWALLDVREPGEAADGHPFGSVNLPYSRLELRIGALVPNRAARLLLVGAGDGVAERAASRLAALGYSEVGVVDGGEPAWSEAGLLCVQGEHVVSKAFGEWMARTEDLPEIDAQDLARLRADGKPVRLIDVRPRDEFQRFTLPDSISCPNGELAARLASLTTPTGPLVVHCAGRTRSLIGAQSIRAFGLADRALALRDGTQGWELAGYERTLGAESLPPSELDVERARQSSWKLIEHLALAVQSAAEVEHMAAWGKRTLYALDPRPADEDPTTTPSGFRRAPATTLVQATDRFLAVRGAIVILWDPILLRAVFAAYWLRRMGWDARIATDLSPPVLPAQEKVADDRPKLSEVPLSDLTDLVQSNVELLDIRSSQAFANCHLAAATWGIRPLLDRLQSAGPFVLIADDLETADLCAVDLQASGSRVLGVHLADTAAWKQAGLPVASSPESPAIDRVTFCAGRHSGNLDDARRYLDWEHGLLDRLERADSIPESWT